MASLPNVPSRPRVRLVSERAAAGSVFSGWSASPFQSEAGGPGVGDGGLHVCFGGGQRVFRRVVGFEGEMPVGDGGVETFRLVDPHGAGVVVVALRVGPFPFAGRRFAWGDGGDVFDLGGPVDVVDDERVAVVSHGRSA